MRSIHIKFIIFILFSISNSISAQSLKEESLIGEWTVTKTKSESKTELFEMTCFPCPKITINGKSILVTTPNWKENYSWVLKNDKIEIKNLEEIKNYYTFKSAGEFKVKITLGNDYVELELTDNKYNSVVMRK